MNKSHLLGAACILLLPLQAISIKPAQAAVLTFEEVTLDLRESVYLSELGPFALHHFDQSHVDVGWNIANYSAFSFSDSLTVSPPNAVGLGDGDRSISLKDGGLFNFQGVYFGAVIDSGTSVTVSGYNNGQLTYTDNIAIGSTEIPIWFDAGWNNVDRVEIAVGFVLNGFTTLDNFTYSVVPIPPALWIFSSGLLGLFGIARKKAS